MESIDGEFPEELFSDLLGIEGIGQDATRGIWFYKDKVKHPDVFSEHEFKCCVKLGVSSRLRQRTVAPTMQYLLILRKKIKG